MKQKKKVSNIMLVLICIMIILYTAANFALQYFASVEVSPTLTTAWFAFWGTELVALAAIKTTKVKHGDSKTEENIENICKNMNFSDNIIDVSDGNKKSLIIIKEKKQTKGYISNISTITLEKRTNKIGGKR